MTRKILISQIFCTGVESPEMVMSSLHHHVEVRRRLRLESQLAGRCMEIKTRANTNRDNVRTGECGAPHFGGASKKIHTPDANLSWRNHLKACSKYNRKQRRKFKVCVCLLFLLATCYFSLSSLRGWLSFCTLIFSPDDNFENVVANKFFC